MADIHIGLDEIHCYFDQLEDPRSTINLRHPFVSVVEGCARSTRAFFQCI